MKCVSIILIMLSSIFNLFSQSIEKPDSIRLPENLPSIYEFKLKSLDGVEISLSKYAGKKMLIVNVASECGYTPQYADLEKLSETYKNNLVVLGFPSNQFGSQEPGSNEEIKSFCKKNYAITFPVFEKSEVKGEGKSPLYQWLTDKSKNGWNEQEPKWNFNKYLVSEKGELIGWYPSKVKPFDEIINSKLR